MKLRLYQDDPVVITGVGLVTALGKDRESTWKALCQGKRAIRPLNGLEFIPDGMLLGATVECNELSNARLKSIRLAEIAAEEAIEDAGINLEKVNRDRFGCSLCGHMGDIQQMRENLGVSATRERDLVQWWEQWLPSSGCSYVGNRFGLGGPRSCYSTACASSLVSFISAVRHIEDNHCDISLAGGADAINSLFAGAFHQMGVLASADTSDPESACRPFDANRAGFVLGEGASIFVVERMSHALSRGAKIYAEVRTGKMLSEARHVTSLETDGEALNYLLESTLDAAGWFPSDVQYVNAHGTGTKQNDQAEMTALARLMGSSAPDLCVSSIKSMIGHCINAAGGVELAATVLGLRDGFAPPTMNLTTVDPECRFNPLAQRGLRTKFQNAIKLSVAFGGHLVAVALRRWNDAASGFAYPDLPASAFAPVSKTIRRAA
jgi:3-oxoacyl-[acyl-carrier-protein] synthase II